MCSQTLDACTRGGGRFTLLAKELEAFKDRLHNFAAVSFCRPLLFARVQIAVLHLRSLILLWVVMASPAVQLFFSTCANMRMLCKSLYCICFLDEAAPPS